MIAMYYKSIFFYINKTKGGKHIQEQKQRTREMRNEGYMLGYMQQNESPV
jgi:hypothetical protein